MAAIDVAPDAGFGLRAEQGVTPATPEPVTDGGEGVFGAAFRQSNSVVSAIQYMRNSGAYEPVPDYNPVTDIKGWRKPSYFLEHGDKFVGSQSPAETYSIKDQIDTEEADKKLLSANGKIGFIAQTVAGSLDPTMLLPGGVAVNSARGGLMFTKAAVEVGKAGFLQTVAQEALLHTTQETRTLEESALNVASGTLLSALIGGGAAALLSTGARIKLEADLHADRAAMNEHAGNPVNPEIIAYHGSPHDFERFDSSKIGTGEGAQAFGHGLYFAQEEAVARGYQEALSGAKIAGANFNPENPLHAAIGLVDEFGSRKKALKEATKRAKDPDPTGFYDQVTSVLKSERELPSIEKSGALYKVNITADHKNFLDLDKPLAEQSEFVRNALLNHPDEMISGTAEKWGHDIKNMYDRIAVRLGQRNGQQFEAAMKGEGYAERQAMASKALADAGIPGLKYLDGNSRDVGKGTSNVVVFDDKHITITHKNGEPVAQEVRQEQVQQLGTGQAMAAGAAGSDTRKIELVPFGLSEIPGVRKVVETTSPMQRGFGADSVAARRAFADLGETPLLMKENLEGKSTVLGGGPAVDREARLMINQGQVAVGDELSRLFSEYRFGEEKTAPRIRAGFEDITGRTPAGKMSFDEFKIAVTDAGRNNDVHEIPQVQMAAQVIRNKVYGALKDRAIGVGLLAEDVGVKTAESYVPRMYNKPAIAAKRPDFVNRVTDWLESDQTTKAQTQVRIEGLAKKISDAETNIEFFTKQLAKTGEDDLLRAGLEGDLIRAMESEKVARVKLEEEVANWEGKSVAEAKAALKARTKAEEGRAPDAKRLKAADKAVEKAVKRILKSDRDMTRAELESRANEITDRILSSSAGRLPYDLGNEHAVAHGGSGELPRGGLAAREFNIPDATIRDFLENDAEHLVAAQLRTMVPDILLTERFGDTAMTETFRKINDEYAALTKAAGSEKEQVRLEKDRQRAITDLSAQRDTIRGLYGIAPDGPMRNVARAVGVIKNYNVLTSMGSAALSSLPDMAGVVMRHGLTTTFNDAWVPFFKMLTKQDDLWKEAAQQYRAMGIAVEMTTASRHHALTDTLDTYHPQSRVERTMQWATGKFQFANMLAPWTDFAKVNASLVTGSEILRAVKASAEGKATARQLRQLGESSIEPHMAERIAKAFETGGEIRDGVHLPNTADWTDKAARRVFEGAVARDVDISVITPGLEKPLWMRDQLLGVMGQFKSFTAAATERILIANLQRRDAQVLQGLIFSMGLGMLSYKLGAVTGGSPTSDKPQDWIKEAISKGGILGWFEEGNALASKATRGGVDIYRLIGADKPLTRFASRSAMDQILGPTAAKIAGILSVTSAASKPSEWSEADTKALRRLVAGQNTFYLRGLFNQVEKSGNDAFGIEMKPKPENR